MQTRSRALISVYKWVLPSLNRLSPEQTASIITTRRAESASSTPDAMLPVRGWSDPDRSGLTRARSDWYHGTITYRATADVLNFRNIWSDTTGDRALLQGSTAELQSACALPINTSAHTEQQTRRWMSPTRACTHTHTNTQITLVCVCVSLRQHGSTRLVLAPHRSALTLQCTHFIQFQSESSNLTLSR